MDWLTLIASLLAILLVIGVVRAAMPGRARIVDPQEAARLANDMVSDFATRDAVVCERGGSALCIGAEGDAVVLKRLGSRYAARRLKPPFVTEPTGERGLSIASGERLFGKIELDFADTDARDRWAARLKDTA